MNKHQLLFLILILFFLPCFAQLPENFPILSQDDLPGAEIINSRIFTGTSLFGYIDGGAELYLEYGFSMVSVTEISYLNGIYKTEVYKMNGPEEAFGIFSVSKYRCLNMPDLSQYACQTRYQLQVCKGPYYISIINGAGTSSDSIASIRIGKILTEKINDDEVDLSGYLPGISDESVQTKCFLAKGRLGIVNGSPDLEDFFRGISDYTAVIVNQDKKTIISVKFKNNESYRKFLEIHNWDNDKALTEGSVRKIAGLQLLIELIN